MATVSPQPTLTVALRRDGSVRELLALAVVPAVLIVVFTLPTETKRELAFSYVDPTPLTAFTAHYVHLAPTHLWGNVFAFVLLAGTGYVLAVLADRRQLFGLAVLVYLFVFPLVLSLLNLAVPREAYTYGFSGINMAMAGFLPLALTLYAGRRLLEGIDHRQAPTLFFLVLALIALIAMPLSAVTAAVTVAAGGAAIGYGYTAYTGVATTERSRELRLAPDAERSGWVELGAISAFVAMAYPLVGFPAEPTAGGTVMNLYVHFLGYSLAFLVPYISLETGLLDGL